MALKLKGKGTAQVSVEKKHKGVTLLEDHKEESVGGGLTSGLAEVGFEASSTINQGNFNSVRVGVSLRMPCHPEDIDLTFDKAKEWVDERVSGLIEEVNGDS